MIAKSKDYTVDWMVFPSKRNPPIQKFYQALDNKIITEMAGHYFVNTIFGTVVEFTKKDVLVFSYQFGTLPMRKFVFDSMFEVEE